jgi:branched-chain amino acid transport system substrate-binding protein
MWFSDFAPPLASFLSSTFGPMKPAARFALALCLLPVTLLACSSQKGGGALLTELTGSQADFGIAATAGAELASAKGDVMGLKPRDHVGIALVQRDTASTPATAKAGAEELVSEVACGIGICDTDSALAAAPVFAKAGKPFVVVGATDPRLPERCGKGTFLACFGDDAQAESIARFATGSFGKRCVVVTDSMYEYTRGLTGYFRGALEREGGSVIAQLDRRGVSFQAELAALKSRAATAGIDFVFVAGLPDGLSDLLGAIRAALPTQPIIGGDGLDCAAVTTSGAAPSDQVYFATHGWFGKGASADAEAFARAYAAAHGAPPPNAFAALGYDAVMIVQLAARRAGGVANPNPAALTKAIGEIRNYHGATGVISFGNGPVPRKDVWIVAVSKGERQLARRMPPGAAMPAKK